MKLVQMADAVRYARMTSAELRETFLLEGMFNPGKIEFAYVDLDRTVIGSAVPTGAALALETQPELRAEYFLERRELGVLMWAGRERLRLMARPSNWTSWTACMWTRSKSVTFASKTAGAPACFYLLSYPAHAEYPTRMVKPRRAQGNRVGVDRDLQQADDLQGDPPGGHPQLPVGDGLYPAGAGKQLEHHARAHAHAAVGGVFLLRRGAGPARDAPDGAAGCNQPHRDGGQGSGGVARMVDPRGRWHQELWILLGMGGENQNYADMDPVAIKDLK